MPHRLQEKQDTFNLLVKLVNENLKLEQEKLELQAQISK